MSIHLLVLIIKLYNAWFCRVTTLASWTNTNQIQSNVEVGYGSKF